MRRLLPFAAVAVVASAATAAAIVIPARAGDGDARPGFRERIAEFEACMKEHGFDISGETKITVRPGEVTINGEKVDAEKFRTAQRACGLPFPGRGPGFGFGLLPRLDRMPGDVPEELRQRMERVRECLEKADES
jgi:hypothetical protein